MLTRRIIVSRLRHELSAHAADSQLYNRHLFHEWWTASRLLLQREADANKLRDQSGVFKEFSIDTEEVNPFEGTCVPLECISCRVPLKGVAHSKTGPIISFVGSPDMSTRYYVVEPNEFVVKQKIKGTKARYAYLDNGYLYLSKCLPCVKVLAVPDSDTSATGGCSILDEVIPFPEYLEQGAFEIARESIIRSLRPYDTIANKNEAQ